jgi:glycogen phosphorylase
VLCPRWPESEGPISHVTNGVHAPTWDSAAADRLWESACGKNRWRSTTEGMGDCIRSVAESDLWQLRAESRRKLVDDVRKRYSRQIAGRGGSPWEISQAEQVLDVDTLTLGFARRFASYKRPNLLLRDPDRLARILSNRRFPAQLVIAGKAHPQDVEGQWMIQQWIEFSRRPEVSSRVVFLSDYDLLMAEKLVQGVDLWINTPRRPWEASGTSGMKVLVNGGLNFSELDGWWAEAYSPEVGWALGDGHEHDASWDSSEAETLYGILEQQIIPEFYNRDDHGIPGSWVARMKESMARLTPRFSANRAVRQYTDQYYVSAASNFKDRSANRGEAGTALLAWRDDIAKHWPRVRFGSATMEQRDGQHTFHVQVFLDDLSPDAVAAELFAEGHNGGAPERHPMNRGDRLVGAENAFLYSANVAAVRPAADFTPRLIPQHPGAIVPLEAPFILWHDSPGWR